MLDGFIHIAPAVVHAKLQRFALELDCMIIAARKFKHVRYPVDRIERTLKVQLDHVAFRLVMDLIIHFVRESEQFEKTRRVILDRDILHRIGHPSGVRIILARVDEILLVRESLVCHARASFPFSQEL